MWDNVFMNPRMNGALPRFHKFWSVMAGLLVLTGGIADPASATTSGSINLSGSGQYVSVPTSPDWNVGTGDFTVEWFQYQTATNSWPRIFTLGTYPARLAVSIETGTFYFWASGQIAGSFSLGANSNYFHKWVHFAVTRSNGTVSIYNDGTRVANFPFANNIDTASFPLLVGSEGTSGTAFPGYLSNFHFVKGEALYSGSSLTRPSAPIVAGSNSKLLLRFTDEANLLTDSSGTGKTVTNVGAAVWDGNNPFTIQAPGAPTLNSATNGVGGSTLSWSIPSYNGGAPILRYEYQLDSGTWVDIGTSGTSASISGLTPGQSYSVKIRAVNSSGAGAESGSRSFTPQKPVPTLTWSPGGTAVTWPVTTATATSSASSNSSGAITYAVQNAGTTGCTFDSGTLVVSFTAAGTCLVRATVAETASFAARTVDVSFVNSKATQTVTWSPQLNLTINQSPHTPSTVASALGGATISYAVNNSGTTGCSVNSSTGVLSFTTAGTCRVRATAAQTTNFNAGFIDTDFVVSNAFTITYNYDGATGGDRPDNAVFAIGGSAIQLPTPTKQGQVFSGWFDAQTGGSKVGDAGGSLTPVADQTLFARWTPQSSGSDRPVVNPPLPRAEAPKPKLSAKPPKNGIAVFVGGQRKQVLSEVNPDSQGKDVSLSGLSIAFKNRVDGAENSSKKVQLVVKKDRALRFSATGTESLSTFAAHLQGKSKPFGKIRANASGVVDGALKLPPRIKKGSHVVQLTTWLKDGSALRIVVNLKIR